MKYQMAENILINIGFRRLNFNTYHPVKIGILFQFKDMLMELKQNLL